MEIILGAWNTWIEEFLTFIWVQKIRTPKIALKECAKKNLCSLYKEVHRTKQKWEEVQVNIEVEQVTPRLLVEEKEDFKAFQKSIWDEYTTWHLKSRSLWLATGNRNIYFFHNKKRLGC
jgi:hypothetical protein